MNLRRQKSQRLAALKANKAIHLNCGKNLETAVVEKQVNTIFNRKIAKSSKIATNFRNYGRPPLRRPAEIMSTDSSRDSAVNDLDVYEVIGLSAQNETISDESTVRRPSSVIEEAAPATGVEDGIAILTNPITRIGAGRRQAIRHHFLEQRIARTYRAFHPTPVKGESFCDCPKQDRDLDCNCGEEDAGEFCILK